MRIIRVFESLVVAAVLAPTTLVAGPATHAFTDLPRLLKTGQTVIVTDGAGQEVKGKVITISDTALEIRDDEARRFLEGAVSSIRRTDSVWNGALIGAGLGAGVVAIGAASTRGTSDRFYWWAYIWSWALPAAGAVTGLFIDRAITATVYTAPPKEPKMTLLFTPLLGAQRRGALVSLRF